MSNVIKEPIVRIRISDSYCTYEITLSEESEQYCVQDFINNVVRKIPGKPKVKIIKEELIE